MFVLLLTGTRARSWPDPIAARAELWWRLDAIHAKHGPVRVRHGGASGIDRWGGEWVEQQPTCEQEVFRPDWDVCAGDCPGWVAHRKRRDDGTTFCPNAGNRRNVAMVNSDPRPDGCLAMIFAGSPGASNCAMLALLAGIPRWVIEHERQGVLW